MDEVNDLTRFVPWRDFFVGAESVNGTIAGHYADELPQDCNQLLPPEAPPWS